MNARPDGLNEQIRKTIEEAIAALEALGCPRQTALDLMVIQAANRIEDQTALRAFRDSLDRMAREYDIADMEDAADGTTH